MILINIFFKLIAALNDWTPSIVIKIVIKYAIPSDISFGIIIIKLATFGFTTSTRIIENTPHANEDNKHICPLILNGLLL